MQTQVRWGILGNSVFNYDKHQILFWEEVPKLCGCNNASYADLEWRWMSFPVLPISLLIGFLAFCSGKTIKNKAYSSIFHEGKQHSKPRARRNATCRCGFCPLKSCLYTKESICQYYNFISIFLCSEQSPSSVIPVISLAIQEPAVSWLSTTWWYPHGRASCTNHFALSAPLVRLIGRSIMWSGCKKQEKQPPFA